MKKRRKAHKYLHLLLIILAFSLICSKIGIKSNAVESAKNEYSLIDGRIDELLSEYGEILPNGMESLINPYESADAVGVSFLLDNVVATIRGELGELFSFLLVLFGMALLMGLAAQQEGEIGQACKNSVFLVSSALILDKIFETVTAIGTSLREINAFFASLIPFVSAVNALGISPGLATAQTAGMSLTLQIYSFFSGSFLYSFFSVMLVLSAVSSLDSRGLGRITGTMKKTFLTLMGILTAFAGGTFALQSLIASAADSGVIRGAKYAVSGMIPIVGGTISGALTTLISGVSYLRSVVGGGSIAVIVSIAIAPLITLILYRACFNAVIFFLGLCAQDGAEGVLGSFVSALDCLIALYSLTVTIYIVQLVVFLKGGAGLA